MDGQIPLTACRCGERLRVTAWRTGASAAARRLAALGILPGAEIVLLQRWPAYVVQASFTQAALDESMAAAVLVRRS